MDIDRSSVVGATIDVIHSRPMDRAGIPSIARPASTKPFIAFFMCWFSVFSWPTPAAEPGQPVVARVEMKFANGKEDVDVIAKGDLLTVVEVRENDYVIVTHDGTRGAVSKVNTVELAASAAIYTELIDENPTEGRFHTLRASAWWAFGDTVKAKEDFDQAIEKGYRESHAYSSRGLFHAAIGNYEEALEDYNKAQELDPEDLAPVINRAAVHMSRQMFTKAAADYSAALKRRPKDASLLRQRAIAYKAAGQLDNAIEDFDSIVDDNPEDFAAVMGRGYIRFQRQEYAAAAADFSAALELNDQDPVAWNNRGYNRYQLGRAKAALVDYERSIELAPEYALAHQNRAWLLATTDVKDLRNPEEAIGAARRACEINSYKNVSDLSALAVALASKGEFKEAVGWQEKVVELAPSDVKVFAEKMLERYRAKKPYIANPVEAEQNDNAAAEAEASKEAREKNDAAVQEAAKKLSERSGKASDAPPAKDKNSNSQARLL